EVLNECRKKQLADQHWFYKVIDVGASNSFLADQFLRTRAGENVLALISSTASLMNADSWVKVLSGMFEEANATPENTPGIKQLLAVRENLVGLGNMTGFRER